MKPTRTRLRVSVADEHGRSIERGLARWLAAVAPAKARGTVHVTLGSDARIRALNRRYRRKDRATDVLSFPASPSPQPRASSPQPRTSSPQPRASSPQLRASRLQPRAPSLLGDIVIARGVAKRQAREATHSEQTELRVLALHGLLHLLGYDHERDNGRMQRVEQRLRRKGGLREGLIERTSS